MTTNGPALLWQTSRGTIDAYDGQSEPGWTLRDTHAPQWYALSRPIHRRNIFVTFPSRPETNMTLSPVAVMAD